MRVSTSQFRLPSPHCTPRGGLFNNPLGAIVTMVTECERVVRQVVRELQAARHKGAIQQNVSSSVPYQRNFDIELG